MWIGLIVAGLIALLPLMYDLWVEHFDAGARTDVWWLNFRRPLSPLASRWRNRR